MTIYDLKPAFQNILRPIVRTIHSLGITPNQITLMTCLASLVYSVFLYLNIENTYFLLSVPFFFFVRMAFNAIDGILAKEFDLKSDLGALLNEVTDVLSDGFLYLAFYSHPLINSELLIIFILLAAITEIAGLSALHIGASRRFDGPMGKSDRAFVISVISLMLYSSNFTSEIYNYVLISISVLCLVTVYNRIKRSLIKS